MNNNNNHFNDFIQHQLIVLALITDGDNVPSVTISTDVKNTFGKVHISVSIDYRLDDFRVSNSEEYYNYYFPYNESYLSKRVMAEEVTDIETVVIMNDIVRDVYQLINIIQYEYHDIEIKLLSGIWENWDHYNKNIFTGEKELLFPAVSQKENVKTFEVCNSYKYNYRVKKEFSDDDKNKLKNHYGVMTKNDFKDMLKHV